MEESTYGFRIWRGGKKITLDNIERTEIVTSSLEKNVAQIEEEKWGKEDVSVPIQFGNGDAVSSVKNGDTVLTEGQDYEVTEDALILKKNTLHPLTADSAWILNLKKAVQQAFRL